MKRSALFGLICLALAGAASAQSGSEQLPQACQPSPSGQIDFAACAEAAPPGSQARMLSLMNLGTMAVQRQDYTAAVRYYDAARPPPPQQAFSDPSFHAARASAYDAVGRSADALADARTTATMLASGPTRPDADVLYALVLPILHASNDPALPAALAAYNALPANDWIAYANRAAVLSELGDFNAALSANAHAMAEQPGHPQVLNNQCYILSRAGRAPEALGFCERAVAAAPDAAPVLHSYAVALAGAGRCTDSAQQLARAHRLDPASVEYSRPIPCQAR